MRSKIILLLPLFLFLAGYAFSQTDPNCIRIKDAAEAAFKKGELRDALVKLRALKVCAPSLSTYVDNKIIAVYDSIRTQKDRAEEAQRKAEAASEAERKAKEDAKREQRKAEASAKAERKAKEDAVKQTEIAEARLKTMVSRKLAGVGLGVQNGTAPEWHLSLLLGMEAMSLSYSPEADHIIRNAMDHLPVFIKKIPKTDSGSSVIYGNEEYGVLTNEKQTKVWQMKTGKAVFSIPGNANNSALFTADNNKVLLASENNRAYIVQLPEGKILDSLMHGQRDVELLALSDDDRFLATLDYDVGELGAMQGSDEVMIWDLHSGKVIQRFSPGVTVGRNYVRVRFKYIKGQLVLIAGYEVWEIGAGKTKAPGRLPGLLTNEGNFMLTRQPDNKGFSLYKFPDTTLLFKGDMEARDFCMSVNGKYFMVSDNYNFQVWDVKEKKKLYEKPSQSEDENSRLTADYVIFSDNGKYFSFGNSPSVWNTYTGEKIVRNFWSETTTAVQVGYNGTGGGMVPVHQLERKDPAYCSWFSTTGDTIYTYTRSGELLMWRISPGSAAAVTKMPMYITDISSTTDGQYISDYEGVYRRRNKGQVDTLHRTRRSVYALAVNERSGLLAFGGDSEFMVPEEIGIRAINLLNRDTAFIPLMATVNTMDIDPEGKLALAGTVTTMTNNKERGLWVIDFTNNTKKKVDSSQLTYYKALFWKSHNKVLFAGGYDILLKDLTRDTVLFSELYSNTRALAVDRAFKYISLGTRERVSVYAMDKDDRPSAPITRHFDGEVVTTDFSTSGDHLLIGLKTKNNKGAVVIWNLKDNSIVLQIATTLPVTKAVFDRSNPDNIIVAEGPLVKAYEWKAEDLLKRAAKRVLRPLTKEEWDTYVGNEFPFHMNK